jgi:hypothetical protein
LRESQAPAVASFNARVARPLLAAMSDLRQLPTSTCCPEADLTRSAQRVRQPATFARFAHGPPTRPNCVPPPATRGKLHLHDLVELKLPVGGVDDPVELGVVIAQEFEARALRDVVPVVAQDVEGIAVSEVLEHDELVSNLAPKYEPNCPEPRT